MRETRGWTQEVTMATVEELQNEIRIRDEFLALLSHELRSPLTVLDMQMGFFHDGLVAGKAYSPEELMKIAQLSQRQIQRMLRQMNSMLELTRLNSGKIVLEREECELGELVRSVIVPGVSVTLHTQESYVAKVDRVRVKQIVTNLISNATQHGSGEVQVRLSRTSDAFVIEVEDSGLGVPAGERELIFERFKRGSQTKGKGLGLGLFIARQLAEAHGGTLQLAESVPGKGARFELRLPAS
ncbi:MAG: sensor histidine kinase [Bdellovibrionota bacterium]